MGSSKYDSLKKAVKTAYFFIIIAENQYFVLLVPLKFSPVTFRQRDRLRDKLEYFLLLNY